jgi:ADP-heptose:LPS heptosyltransferase
LKKILIISTTGMGDSLWGTPAIRAVKKMFPQDSIDLLIQPQWISLFKGNKNIHNLISYHPKWYHQIFLLPHLLKNNYDHVLIFHANKDIGRILPWLRTSSILSHQSTTILPRLSKNNILSIDKPVHGILRRIAMVKKIHVPSDGTHMDICLSDNEINEATLFLKKNNILSKGFIYLNIGGSVIYKRWPINKFILLSKTILQKTSLSIVLGGGPEDKSRVDEISNQLDRRRVAKASHRSLIENCALISQTRILITPDSGPMHIGYALKVPTISLFWLKNSQGLQRNVFNGPDYCGPLDIDKSLSSVISGNFMDNKMTDSKDPEIPESIKVEDVWSKIIEFL